MMQKNNKIKIAYIIDSINSVSGTEKQLIDTIKKIDKNTFEIFLICLRSPIVKFCSIKNIRYIELGVGSLVSIKCIKKIIFVSFFLRKNKINIIQSFFVDSFMFASICYLFGNTNIFISSRRDLGYWQNKKLIFVFKFFNNFVTRFWVNSMAVRKYIVELEKIKENKIDTIYNGINLDIYLENNSTKFSFCKKWKISESDKIVGILANYSRRIKRVDLFIQASAEILATNKNVKFVIVGGGVLRNELELLAHSLGVSANIVFTGILHDVHEILKYWNVGVLTSDSEGFSNSILEYMASGLPVVATDVGGNPELVCNGKSGFLVPPGDHIALAEKISQLLSNEKLSRKMGEEGRRFVKENFAWDKKIKEIEEYYRGLVKN